MTRAISRGKCAFCGKSFARNMISRHLVACEERLVAQLDPPAGRDPLRTVQIVQLFIWDGPDYWLHIEAPVDATLQQLDQFLRNIWLECCGHRSAFRLAGKQAVWAFEVNELSMTRKVKGAFRPDVLVHHEYGFDLITTLELKYVIERKADMRGYDVTLLARNEPPLYTCTICDQLATDVCMRCHSDRTRGWLCDSHANSHVCGEMLRLPVVNSPRVGVCNYDGSTAYADL